MSRINMNDMAKKVAEDEGGKVQMNIAQIKEVLKDFLEELSKCSDDEVKELISRYEDALGALGVNISE
jgi:predicted DNA-binding antitoxin AbrB/MazE fold protein